MKHLTYKLWAKITALLLFAVFATFATLGCIASLYYMAFDGFLDDGETLRNSINTSLLNQSAYQIALRYESLLNEDYDSDEEVFCALDEAYADTNLRFAIFDDEDGTLLHANYDTEREQTQYSGRNIYYPEVYDELTDETYEFDTYGEMDAFLSELMEENSIYNIVQDSRFRKDGSEYYFLLVSFANNHRIRVVTSLAEELDAADEYRRLNECLDLLLDDADFFLLRTALLVVACAVLFIYLLCAAGRHEGVEGVSLSWFDRIPLELLYFVLFSIGVLGVALLFEFFYYSAFYMMKIIAVALIAFIVSLLVMSALMTFAARVKAGKWWRNTLCWRIFDLCARLLRRVARFIAGLWRAATGCWQLVLILLGIVLLEFLSLFSFGAGVIGLWFLLDHIVVGVLAILLMFSFRRIEAGGKALAEGNLHHQVPTDLTVPPFRKHAEHLNSISVGMQRAVEQQLRSERTKTELITNVSHDIKTPLTSIVNYVDLLKGLDIQDETAREYLDVLDRQSQRLRKLTEDLVEASKASAGNIPVHSEATDPQLLLAQAAGEYEDRFREVPLELVNRPAAQNVQILADGKLLWRVFDNLLGNICKYSLPGTRVYLTTEVQEGRVTVSFKNISRYELDISSDELMERFVRGDTSRSTEGSGLGLSIAKSLISLQGGTFQISIDGDLFRADVSFPILP